MTEKIGETDREGSSATVTRLAVNGAPGRVGARICALASTDSRFRIVAAAGRENGAIVLREGVSAIDVVIDFSSPEGVRNAIDVALDFAASLLVGTTGLPVEILRALDDAARSIPVMIAPNTSLGVAVVNHLVSEAARRLGDGFDIDLIDCHHTSKRDAPSGTAKRFVGTLRDRAGVELPADRVHSIRAGDVVGEHSVFFSGIGERVTISHSATSRDVFARGALRAAAWLHGRPPGRYTIEHALGLA